MRIKCRGYEGDLIDLEANEVAVRNPFTLKLIRDIPSYDISIRVDDGAVVDLECVQKSEIEVVNG